MKAFDEFGRQTAVRLAPSFSLRRSAPNNVGADERGRIDILTPASDLIPPSRCSTSGPGIR